MNVVYRITLEGTGGATLDSLCRQAMRIRECFSINHTQVIHNDTLYDVEPQPPYIAREVEISKL